MRTEPRLLGLFLEGHVSLNAGQNVVWEMLQIFA